MTNIYIKRQLKSGDKYTLDFNYHTGIKSLVEFKDKFDTENMVVYKNEAVDLLNDLYGLELDE